MNSLVAEVITSGWKMIEPDEFSNFETLEPSTIEFAREASKIFKKRYGKISSGIVDDLRKFADVPMTMQARINGKHSARLYKEKGIYRLVVDRKEVASSSSLITWFSVSDDFDRVAYFETDGSDEGILYILKSGTVQEKITGFFNQVLFFGDTYYAVQAFRGKNIPAGVPLNSQRVTLNGEIVWGDDVSEVEFISLSNFGEECIVAVGNWLKASIYRGKLKDPASWTKEVSLEHPAYPLGIRDGAIYLLEYAGYGAISRNGEIIVKFENPVEEFSGSIEPAMMLGDRLLAFTLKDAKLLPVVYDLAGSRQSVLPAYEFSALSASCHDMERAVFYSTSMGKPEIVYSYAGEKLVSVSENNLLDVEMKEGFVLNGNTKVHYFLGSGKSSRHDRAVVYGYGGFNIGVTPGYRPSYAYLLSKGTDIIFCNLRGGNEYGEEWHLQGTRENKINVFDDFRSVLEHLRKQGYRVVIEGASNGGLLTSYALLNFHDLINGAVVGKPVIDMLRFHKLLAGVYWTNEYGNPDDASDRRFLSSYSPYHNIKDRVYPPSLIWIRMNDDRVHPAHGMKFYARLKKTGSTTYLRADFSGGHIGLRHEAMLDESADIIAFIQSCLDG